MTLLKCCLHLISFVADLSPLGSFKSGVELLTGRNFITQEKLSGKERLLCAVGIIPYFGKAAQKIAMAKNSAKIAKGIYCGTKIVNIANKGININNGKKLYKEFRESIPTTIRGMEDSLCEIADFIRYDDGLVATSIRTLDAVACSFAAPFIYGVKCIAAICYYGSGYGLGRTKEEMDKSLEKMGDTFSTKYDKAIDYLAQGGFNARFLGDVGAAFGQVINYYNIANLSDEGLERVQGLQNEASRRYNERKRSPGGNDYIKPNQENWKQNNNERFRFNRGWEKAKQNAIKDDLKKNEGKNRNPFNFSFPGGWIFGGLLGYLGRLFGSLWWIMKNNFMNYWKNRFGNGSYGFHTCPYGCGRPIPDSFRGCTELLAAFPDYFK